jgi:hypothetical protein
MVEAARAARAEEVAELLRHGADPNTKDARGVSAIHAAMQCKAAVGKPELAARISIARALLEMGVDLEQVDDRGRTVLAKACLLAGGRAKELVALVLARGPKLSAADADGYTILHLAVAYDHEPLFRAALNGGVDVDARDGEGGTALFHAAYAGKLELVRELLAAGAAPNLATRRGYTPLRSAVWIGSLPIVKLLLEHGGDPSIVDKEHGYSMVEVAAFRRHGPVLSHLLGAGLPPGGALTTLGGRFGSDGRSGKSKLEALVRALIEAGADVRAPNAEGATALERFLDGRPRDWNLAVVLQLVEAGASLDVEAKVEMTPNVFARVSARDVLGSATPDGVADEATFARIRDLVRAAPARNVET